MRLLLVIALLALPRMARAEVERFTLPNGLQVVLAPDLHATRTVLLVRYAVGSRDNPRGYRGLAHLTEHLTFSQLDALAELEKLGATEIHGSTSLDVTTYAAYLPRRSLESALWLEASRMAFHLDRLDERELKNNEEVVVAEWHERRHDSGVSKAEQKLVSLLYPAAHPYHTRGDDPDDVRAIQLRDVHWFAQEFYRPDRASLVVVGAFDREQVRGWIERYFGAVRAAGTPSPRFMQAAPAPLRQRCELEVPASLVDEAAIATWLGPPRGSDDDVVLQVIDRLLDGNPGAPLRKLRHTDPDVADTTVQHIYLELAHEIRIGLHARGEIEAEQLLPKLDAALAPLHREQPQAAVSSAIDAAIDRARRAQDGLAEKAIALATEEEPVAQRIARLAKVTPEDVVRVARKWLAPQRRVITFYTSRNAELGRIRTDCEATP